MSVLVVDASVAAKWLVQEEHTELALRLLSPQHDLHAPDFFLLEMDNIICKWLRRGLVDVPLADEMRTALRTMAIGLHPLVQSLNAAYHVAADSGSSVYDALYVALAVSLDAQVATADRRLYEAVAEGPLGKHLLWVEDIE